MTIGKLCHDASCKSKIYSVVESVNKSHKYNKRYAPRPKKRHGKRRRRIFVEEGNTTSSGDEPCADQTAPHQWEEKSIEVWHKHCVREQLKSRIMQWTGEDCILKFLKKLDSIAKETYHCTNAMVRKQVKFSSLAVLLLLRVLLGALLVLLGAVVIAVFLCSERM